MWPEEQKTQELLLLVRDGGDSDGDEAVNRLLERHRDALRRMVDLRMDRALKRRVDASDVVQDVMLEANGRLRAYLEDPKMPFHLWLRHLARDRIIDVHRQHRVAAKRSLDREQPLVAPAGLDRSTMELAAELCAAGRSPASEAAWRELQVRFQQAVDLLDEQDREIVQMRHAEQLSNSEVATALGLSPPAASMRYLRAIRRLKAVLDEATSTGEAAP